MENHEEEWRLFLAHCVWRMIHFLPKICRFCNFEDYKIIIYTLVEIFTCIKCRTNLFYNLNSLDINQYMKDSDTLFLWSYYLHDLVNRELGKKSPPYSEVIKIYQNMNIKEYLYPCLWRVIHGLAVTFKKEMAQSFKMMIVCLIKIIPDSRLFQKYLKQFPIEDYLENNEMLFFWTFLMHDLINKELKKKSPSYTDVSKLYFKYLGGECKSCEIKNQI